MTIKLNNLTKWQELPADKSLVLRGDSGVRKIVLNLNTEAPTSFVALDKDGVQYFLGVVDGQDAIHFSADGEVEVSYTSDGVVWYWTDDGDDHSLEHEEGYRLFVKPMTREQRSPEMDALALKMQERADRRFALQEANNQMLRQQLTTEREQRDAERAAAAEAAQIALDAAARAGEQEPGGEGAAPSA